MHTYIIRIHTCIRVYLSIFQIDTCIRDTIHMHTYAYIHVHIYVCSHTSLTPHVARAAVRCMYACAIYHWARQGHAHAGEKSLAC
jgi:hypothetical protein